MKYFSKIVLQSALLVLSARALPVTPQKNKVIKILTDKPDSIIATKWNDYCSSIKNFFTTTEAENLLLHEYDIDFTFNYDELYDKKSTNSYETYLNSIIKELKENNYDMMILDDKFLFSENAYIQSQYIDSTFGKNIHNEYLDLTSDINKDSLSFHDSKILSDGYYDNHLYAIPFEKDFDVIFYRNDNASFGNVNMINVSWDDLVNINTEASVNKLSVPLGNSDELLHLFIEYANEKIDLSGNNKESNYEKLYNQNSKDIFNSFSSFVTKFGTNITSEITFIDAYETFINGKSSVFKGKASHYHAILNTPNGKNVMMQLPPKNTSIINNKYIVINKNSLLDKKVLIEAAKRLTSKEMQLYKAEQFGKIPTFDMTQRDSDPSIKTYSEKNPELLNIISKIIPLHLKDIFKSEFSAPFMEVRILLPQDIRKYLKEKNNNDLSNVIENIKMLLMDKSNVIHFPTYLLYAPIIIFTLLAIIVVILIFKYRNYSCLKIFSPGFCILSIIGIIMSIIHPMISMENTNPNVCKYLYIYETIFTDLTLFPMVAVTYRLYTIYSSKAKDNKIKHLNTRINIFFIIAMLIMVFYSAAVSLFILNFYFHSYGTIDTYRQQVCTYSDNGIFESIERRVNELIYIVMIVLIVRTGKVCKKYGAFKYIYIMFCIGIMEYAFNFILNYLPTNGYFGFYLISIIIKTVLNGLLIYYLVGSRLIYVIKHRNNADNLNYE
ncbi:hypothetical protein BCR36DRAFT_322626, partial [Piromyces finnis]